MADSIFRRRIVQVGNQVSIDLLHGSALETEFVGHAAAEYDRLGCMLISIIHEINFIVLRSSLALR